jgi:flagellar assembly protein FliH
MSEALIQKIRVSDARPHDNSFRPMLAKVASDEALEDAPVADLYALGFEEGQQMAAQAFEIEQATLMKLIASADALQSEPSEELAVLIGEAVDRLVSEIIGNAPIDRDWLNTHAKRAADMVAECDSARTMWVHPDDLPLIDSNLISLTLMSDPEAKRGSIRIDCSTGWIEHGTALYLDELRTELGLGLGLGGQGA